MVFSMTPQQIEEMNQSAAEHYKKTNWVPTEWAVLNYQAGYKAAMEKAKVLEDALDWYAQTGDGVYSQAHLYLRAKAALSKYRGEG